MITQSMIAGLALLTLAAGPTSPAAVGELPDAKSPVWLTEKRYTDDAGRTLVLRFEGTEKGKAFHVQATDKEGKPLEVVKLPVKDITVCLPKARASSIVKAEAAKPLCQPLAFVTDGAFLKMGTATCTCQVYSGYVYCYGDTCH